MLWPSPPVHISKFTYNFFLLSFSNSSITYHLRDEDTQWFMLFEDDTLHNMRIYLFEVWWRYVDYLFLLGIGWVAKIFTQKVFFFLNILCGLSLCIWREKCWKFCSAVSSNHQKQLYFRYNMFAYRAEFQWSYSRSGNRSSSWKSFFFSI